MMNPIVAPELFQLLIQYSRDIKSGKIKPKAAIGSASPALTFCENFYAQYFQNKLGKEIKGFGLVDKAKAIGLRLDAKASGAFPVEVQLITWYEKLCDIYPTVLALGYGTASKTAFSEFHNGYLTTLLQRILEWTQFEKDAVLEGRTREAIAALSDALKSVSL